MTEKEELKQFASIIGYMCYEDNILGYMCCEDNVGSTEIITKTNSDIKSFGIIKIEFSKENKKEKRDIIITLTNPQQMTKNGEQFITRLGACAKKIIEFSKIQIIFIEEPEGLFSVFENKGIEIESDECEKANNKNHSDLSTKNKEAVSIKDAPTKEALVAIAEMMVLQSRITKRQTDILSEHYKLKNITVDNIPISDKEKLDREFKVIERHIDHMQELLETLY